MYHMHSLYALPFFAFFSFFFPLYQTHEIKRSDIKRVRCRASYREERVSIAEPALAELDQLSLFTMSYETDL